MPVHQSSRCHASPMVREGLLYSGILRQLTHKTPAYPCGIRGKRKFTPVQSYASIFATAFARGWPLRSVSTAATFTSAFRYFPLAPPSGGPALPCPYLNNRSTLSQVRSAHSYRSFFPRKFIASFNNALFFFFFCFLFERARGRKRAISTFSTIKELGLSASATLPLLSPRYLLLSLIRSAPIYSTWTLRDHKQIETERTCVFNSSFSPRTFHFDRVLIYSLNSGFFLILVKTNKWN